MAVVYRNHVTVEPNKVIERFILDDKDARIFLDERSWTYSY